MRQPVVQLCAVTMILGQFLVSCQTTPSEMTEALTLNTNLTQQTLASATCTRGNSPVVLKVAPNGSASGRIVGVSTSWSGSVITTGPQSVVYKPDPGQSADGKIINETLKPFESGDEVRLRGESFECKDVRVRKAA